MRYVILKLLREKPMHGYEVMKALTEETDGWYKPSPGTVYPTLQWLEDEGHVSCEETEGKKVYSITEAGLAFLEENRPIVEDIFERVEETIDSLFGDPMPDVTRLVGQLLNKTYRVAWKVRNEPAEQEKLLAVLEHAIEEVDGVAEPPAQDSPE
jgi:DNA-binding PadR family transcriptional regulator